MKFCIVTGFDKTYADVANISIPNYLKYANRHNFDLHISTQSVYPSSIPWAYNKFQVIKSVLPNYDWVMWIDIDCLFIKQSVSVTTLLDNNYNFILGINRQSPDWYMEDTSYLESGVFLMKNEKKSFEMLNLFSSQIIPHPWNEQYMIIKTIRENQNYDGLTKKLELSQINSMYNYPQDIKDIFIFHVAGGSTIPLNKRIEIMTEKSKYEY